MKCAHLFTNERAPETDHAPCSWSAEVWLVHRVVWMALLINKETKQTTLAPPTKLTVRSKSISLSGGQWKGCVVRIEDRALPICFVQDKRTVSRLFIKRLWWIPHSGGMFESHRLWEPRGWICLLPRKSQVPAEVNMKENRERRKRFIQLLEVTQRGTWMGAGWETTLHLVAAILHTSHDSR